MHATTAGATGPCDLVSSSQWRMPSQITSAHSRCSSKKPTSLESHEGVNDFAAEDVPFRKCILTGTLKAAPMLKTPLAFLVDTGGELKIWLRISFLGLVVNFNQENNSQEFAFQVQTRFAPQLVHRNDRV